MAVNSAARAEFGRLLELVDLTLDKRLIEVSHLTKPPAAEEQQHEAIILQLALKQKVCIRICWMAFGIYCACPLQQLTAVSEMFAAAATRLEAVCNREQDYYLYLAAMRKHWSLKVFSQAHRKRIYLDSTLRLQNDNELVCYLPPGDPTAPARCVALPSALNRMRLVVHTKMLPDIVDGASVELPKPQADLPPPLLPERACGWCVCEDAQRSAYAFEGFRLVCSLLDFVGCTLVPDELFFSRR